MATKTDFLGLTLPANNEFNNVWDQPINKNFQAIDAELEEHATELASARFSKTSLAEFLAVSHLDDGTLKPSAEISAARNSPVYGADSGGTDYLLKDRLDLGDREIYSAREGLDSLLESLARRLLNNDHPDRTLDGAKTVNGVPNFLASSGSEFLLNGDPVPVYFNISGHIMRIVDDLNVNVTGADGTKYLVASRPTTPFVVYDNSTQQEGSITTNQLNNDKPQVFQDTTADFSALKIRPGMTLRILNSINAGDYIIDAINYDADPAKLLIIGTFASILGSLNYVILDPLRPEFTVETSYAPSPGKCYVGEGSFVSGALTSAFAYHFKNRFDSPFVAVDLSTLPTFEVILNHNLGYIPTNIRIFASLANDETQPLEPLSTSLVGHDLDVNINDTLSFTPASFDPGTTDASYTPGSLSGSVDGSVIGNVYALRSVQVKVTRTQITIKNVKDNHFYRDYSGTDQDQGYLKVVCER